MQRHPALQDLSRDHFVALNAIVAVRRVVENDRFAESEEKVREQFVSLAGGTLVDHFEEEEALLLPILEAGQGRSLARRLRDDHARLRTGFEQVMAGHDLDVLWRVAKDLRDHIRWEEDQLFESLQKWLSEEELRALQTASNGFRRAHALPLGPG